MSARHLHITGFVQGVFFRATAKEVADRLGITGWARNCSDGSVEIHAEGSDGALEEFQTWCRRGPPGAHVENVEAHGVQSEGQTSFTVRRD